MSGLFEEYGIDPDEIPDAPSYDIPDGVYRFEIGRTFTWESDEGDRRAFVVEYLVDDEEGVTGTTSEWFNLPEDPGAPTEAEVKKLGFLKQRLISLGVPREELGTFEGEQLEGIEGTLQLRTTAGKGKNKGKSFQNVRNVTVDEAEAEAPEAPPTRVAAKVGRTTAAPAAKKNPFAKVAAK